MTKQSIIDAINTRIGKTSYGAWRIGLTHDPAGRKTYWKDSESKDIYCWSLWTADSLSDAQDIENYFINVKGMTGGMDGDMDSSKTAYVYIF